MIRKAFLLLAVVLVGVPGVFLTFEHFRGRRVLSRTIARLTAQGERLDIAVIDPPPSAGASNNFERLLRLTPFLEGGSSVSPPAMRCISAGRAVPSAHLDSWEAGPRSTVTWSAVSEWTTRSEEAFQKLHAVLALPEVRSSPNYAEGFKMKLPHIAPIKTTCLALSVSAALATHEGDFDQAITDLEDIRRATAILGQEPTIISQLVHNAVVAIALNRAWDILHARAWTDAQLVRLDAALPPENLLADMVAALEGERAMGLIAMRNIQGSEIVEMLEGFSAALGGNPTPSFTMPDSLEAATELAGAMSSAFAASVRRHVLMPLWKFAFNDHAIAAYLEAMQKFIQDSRKTRDSHRMPATPPAGTLASLFDRTSSTMDWSKDLYANSAIPVLNHALDKAFVSDIQRTLLRTDIALQRFKLRHGQYPASLETLVPEFLPAIPVDPADGQPIRYRFSPGQPHPKLWSAGENRIDDDGDPTPGEYKLSASFYWWHGKDAVLPQPASPTEIAAQIAAEEKSRRRPARTASTNASSPVQMSQDLMKRYGLVPAANPGSSTNAPAPSQP